MIETIKITIEKWEACLNWSEETFRINALISNRIDLFPSNGCKVCKEVGNNCRYCPFSLKRDGVVKECGERESYVKYSSAISNQDYKLFREGVRECVEIMKEVYQVLRMKR